MIYTCDVKSAEKDLDVGALVVKTEQVFLVKMDWDDVIPEIRRKIAAKEKLTDDEMMKLIILPLTKKGQEAKAKMIDEVIDVTLQLKDVDDKAGTFALAAMYVGLINYISPKQEDRIMEVMNMTGIGQRYEERERKAVSEAVTLAKAEAMVNSVDQLIKNLHLSIEDACTALGINKDAYDIAKQYTEEQSENKEAVAV